MVYRVNSFSINLFFAVSPRNECCDQKMATVNLCVTIFLVWVRDTEPNRVLCMVEFYAVVRAIV